MQEKKPDLFETLHACVGCEYISDLQRIAKISPLTIADALHTITAEDFPLAQWNDALDYFFKAPALTTATEAYNHLLSALSEAETIR